MQWLLAGRLIDGTGAPVRHAVALGIEDERIRAMRPIVNWQPAPDEPVIDQRAASVIPGLIDSHVHLVFDHAADTAAIRQRVQCSDPVQLALLAARNAAMCLAAGITTVRDCGGRDLVTLHVRDAMAGGWLTGPRIQAAGPPITRHGGHLEWCGTLANDAGELRRTVASLCDSGVDFLKVVASGGNMTPGSRPFEPSYSEAELRAAVEAAHERGRRVAVHALNAEAIRRAVAAGVDSIEHCLWNSPDGQPAFDEAAAHTLVARGVYVGVNMAGVDRILLPTEHDDPATITRNRDKLRDRWAAARKMLALGARVMLSSDAGTRYARFEDFALSLVCALEALDISPVEAIHRATQVPAQALGIDADLGTLEMGKRADLVVVEGDPSTSIADVRRVREVWRDGRVVANTNGLAAPAEVPLIVAEADRR